MANDVPSLFLFLSIYLSQPSCLSELSSRANPVKTDGKKFLIVVVAYSGFFLVLDMFDTTARRLPPVFRDSNLRLNPFTIIVTGARESSGKRELLDSVLPFSLSLSLSCRETTTVYDSNYAGSNVDTPRSIKKN